MPKGHIVKAFDEELADLTRLIVEMGGLVESQLASAIEVLVKHMPDEARLVIAQDKKIDEIEEAIDQRATKLLALRQPMGEDLRNIVSALKMSNNLERMGDYSKNIAKRAITISNLPILTKTSASVENMGEMVRLMIRETLDAYIRRDCDLAVAVIGRDQQVDQIHTSLFREILTYMSANPDTATSCTHLLFIVKNIERIGDHTTNLAEQIYYSVSGKKIQELRTKEDRSAYIAVDNEPS
jgi:phosphate transport system protein